MYIGFIMLLSAVLAALSVVSLVKNFLISFNVSDNGWKTALVALLVIICLWCSLIGYSDAYTIKEIKVMQPSTGITQADINQLRSQIPLKTAIVTVSICIGYIAYLLHLLLIKNIKEYKLKLIESSADRRWTHV